MPKLTDILHVNGNILNFAKDIEVINALTEVAETWRENRTTFSNQGISSVFDLISSIQNDQAFFDALADLGLDSGRLMGAVTIVSQALDRIPEKFRKLVQPLSEFDEEKVGANPGLVPWSILDVGKSGGGGVNIGYAFDVGATAELKLEAGDTWPLTDETMPDPLLRLGMHGALNATGSATLPLKFGSAKVGTANEATTALDYYFHPESNRGIYSAAVATRLRDLCNPFSLNSTWQSLMNSDLKGIIVKVDGSTSLDIKVGLAEGFTIAEELITAEVGLTVGVKVKRAAEYNLVLRALPTTSNAPDVIEATLFRKNLREHGHSLGLGIDVDMKELAGRLRGILKRHQGSFEEILNEYQDFLSPGTYLQTKLNSALKKGIDSILDDTDTRNVLKGVVAGLTGVDKKPTLATVKTVISKEVTSALDSVGEVVAGKAQFVAADASKLIAQKLGLDSTVVINKLESELEQLIDEVQNKLQDTITSLSTKRLEKLTISLKKAGVAVTNAASSVNGVFQGVREVIGKYESLLKKLIAATEDAVRAKITAKLTYEETRSKGMSIDVKMLISSNTAATNDAFDTLIRGDMNGIIELLRQSPPGISFDRENMELTRFATVHKKFGFDLVFLGFELGSQSIFDADAHVTSDGAGRVSVKSKGTWVRYKTSPKEEREVQFVDAFELTAASITKNLRINLSISHQDESLKQHEIVSFLRSFEMAYLLPQGTTERAVDTFNSWIGSGDNREIKADINLGLSLDHKACTRMLRLSERASGQLTEACKKGIFRLILRELIESGAYLINQVAEIADAVRAQTHMEESKPRIDVLYDYTGTLHKRTVGDPRLSPTFHKARIRELEKAARIHQLCIGFVEFTEIMGDIYEASPAMGQDEGWTENDYLKAQSQLNKRIKNWLRIKSKFVFWIDDEAHPRTVAFIGGLIAMANSAVGPEQHSMLALSLVRRDGTSGDVTLV